MKLKDKTILNILKTIQTHLGYDPTYYHIPDGIFRFYTKYDPDALDNFIQSYINKGEVGDLDLRGTDIKSLPKGLKCKKLDLTGNKELDHLPRIQAEVIKLTLTKIKSLPKGLKCEVLDLSGNKELDHLPLIQVDNIYLGYTKIKSLPEGLKCKRLILWENETLTHLPPIQAEWIDLRRTNIKSLPEGLKCKELNLRGNKTLDEFPKGLECDKLYLDYTFFSENYTEKQIRQEIEDKGGKVNRIIL